MPLWSHDKWQGNDDNEILLLRIKRPHLRSSTVTFTTVRSKEKESGNRVYTAFGNVLTGLGSFECPDSNGKCVAPKIRTKYLFWQRLNLFLSWIYYRSCRKICPRIYLAHQRTPWARTALCPHCHWKLPSTEVSIPFRTLTLFSSHD